MHRFVSFRLSSADSLWSTVKIAATAPTTQGNSPSQPSAVRHQTSDIRHHCLPRPPRLVPPPSHLPARLRRRVRAALAHGRAAASHPGAAYDTASEPLQAGSSSVRRRVVQLGAPHSRGGLYSSLCYCHGRPVLCTHCRFFSRSLAFRLTLLALYYLQRPIVPVRDSSCAPTPTQIPPSCDRATRPPALHHRHRSHRRVAAEPCPATGLCLTFASAAAVWSRFPRTAV